MGLSRKHINHSVDRSLERLGLAAIDLYQMHCIDGGTGLDEVIDTLEDLVRGGKILHYCLSNFTPSAIARMVCGATYRACHCPASRQLNWMRRNEAISSILIGARTMQQLKASLDCLSWDMRPEDEETLDLVSDMPRPYPYSFIDRYSRKPR